MHGLQNAFDLIELRCKVAFVSLEFRKNVLEHRHISDPIRTRQVLKSTRESSRFRV